MNNTISKVGMWAGIAAFIATVAFVVVQMLQIVRILPYPWDEIQFMALLFA